MKTMNETIEKITYDVLGFDTLDVRYSDVLDFYTFSVWQMKVALEMAYNAGKESEQ